jgi:N-acetyl-anhydromuramyl-L-alanine amidase AmpD
MTLVAGLATVAPAEALEHGAPRSSDQITGIVIHAIGGPYCDGGELKWSPAGKRSAAHWIAWFARQPEKGIHYVIDREGGIAAGIPETEVAFHATVENPRTIGIELVNDGDGKDPFTAKQVAALTELVRSLRAKYKIAPERVLRHSDVDKRRMEGCDFPRRVDPGPLLDLDKIVSPTP